MAPLRRERRSRSGLPRGLHRARRADGSTYYYTRVCIDGEDRRVGHDTDNRDDACSRHHAMRARGLTAKSGTSVDDAWRRWVELDIGTRWNEKGRHLVEGRFEKHVSPLLGRKKVSNLAGDDTRRLARALAASGLSVQTQAHVLGHWSGFCRWLVDEDYIHKSPVPRGLRPRVPVTVPDPLTDEEVKAVLAKDSVGRYVIGEQHALAVRLILATGARWSDLVKLQASDLTPDGWLTFTCSKTGKLIRTPLGGIDPDLAREIRRRVGRLVPRSKNGVGSFNRTVQGRSGVQGFTTYRAKDTFGCRWLDGGGTLTDLQQVFGHADPRTTMRYGRASDARMMGEAIRLREAQR